MTRFPTMLPLEIVSNIFSRLDQDDCIECMFVCRQWYSEVPLYGTDLWKSFDASSKSRNNDCTIRLLGPHTQRVSLRGIDDPSLILNKLKERNCSIKIFEISDFPIRFAPVTNLFSAIIQYHCTLKELAIQDCPQNLPIPKLLKRLPNLTHLSLWFEGALLQEVLSDEQILGTDTCQSNLTDLKLNGTVLDLDNHIISTLRCCPKLKMLVFFQAVALLRPLLASDLVQIFQLCPEIRYFSCCDSLEWKSEIMLCDPCNDGMHHGIHGFEFGGALQDLHDIITVLVKSERTLKYLRLVNRPFLSSRDDGLENLFRLRFSQLKHLQLVRVLVPPDSWTTFLAGLQDVQYVSLVSTPITDRALLELSRFRSLKELVIRPKRSSDVSMESLLDFADNLGIMNICLDRLELTRFNYLNDQILIRLAGVKRLSQLLVSFNDLITMSGVEHFCSKSKGKSKKLTIFSCINIEDGTWISQSESLHRYE
ncbi:hypothetical protein BJV82DRAFT_673446 [Fennellomyces sp. T-0311]|nr:hypothetical protein BJV82DRAFT_673446 [Fennellomyces sp. T-0311]